MEVAIIPVAPPITRTNYKKLKNRCYKCGHRMIMQNDIGICTVETADGKCKCTSHFYTAQLLK